MIHFFNCRQTNKQRKKRRETEIDYPLFAMYVFIYLNYNKRYLRQRLFYGIMMNSFKINSEKRVLLFKEKKMIDDRKLTYFL